MSNQERVFLVGIEDGKIEDFEGFMDETRELVEAAEGNLISETTQTLRNASASTVIGAGKVREIKIYCEELDIDTVVFTCELTGSQIKNLEEGIDRKIIDRTNLILDIFAKRAKSRQGKLQVHLAQLEYRLPRLTGLRSDLSRLGGGIGTRGPGEQKLEVDRRHIQREINAVKEKLKEIEKHRSIQRSRRSQSNIPIVALVGYTNAGKSTIINRMMRKYSENPERDKKRVFTKDMLFATLEPSLRRILLPNGMPVILADTVGFVSELPEKLIEAFKATLDEIREADLLVHVIDGSNENIDIQYETTLDILDDLEVIDIPKLTVVNKMDKKQEGIVPLALLEEDPFYMSALRNEDIEALAEKMTEELFANFEEKTLLMPYEHSSKAYRLVDHQGFEILEHKNNGILLNGYLRRGNGDYDQWLVSNHD